MNNLQVQKNLFHIVEIIKQKNMASSSNKLDSALDFIAPVISALRENLEYNRASNVNVSNFVSVKLSGPSNYNIWKAQMLCLIKSQALLHMVDAGCPSPPGIRMISQYDDLVKGWIFGSMHEKVLKDSIHLGTAQEVWKKLESLYTRPISLKQGSVKFVLRKDLSREVPEIENTDIIRVKNELYEAAVDGCWWKAKSILKIHKNETREAITENGNTILHIAVEMGHNYFVEKLLDCLEYGEDIETQNDKGRTALHIAAMVDNTRAAQLLVQKRVELLVILDHNQQSPLDSALSNTKLNISAYLLKSTLNSDLRSYSDAYQDNVVRATVAAIYTKQYDLARTFLEKYPEIARDKSVILFIITMTFPPDLGFIESFIYPSFHVYACQKPVVRDSLLFHSNFLDKCMDDIWKIYNNMCRSWLGNISMILFVTIATLYPIYQLICLFILVLRLTFSMFYFLLWKVLAFTGGPIKNIENKLSEYKEAKKILSLICDQMGTSNDGYRESLFEAVRRGSYHVVDEILFRAPDYINCEDEEGQNIIQLSILNRSENTYNLIYHIIDRTESYRKKIDSSENNLAHLVGRLAPSSVLSRTTGAALQLQRELLWFEEVRKLMSPIELGKHNIFEETPDMVFTREHKDLMKQGENWMKTTSESCSITAALIVTVVFAAAITVPGGSNQESGVPVFRKEIAFTIFAISNAFSLFAAATALLLFLSILTARFSERDFLYNLPTKLILGLVTLFLSTTAMIVAFGAILFLVFCDQRPWMLAPIFGFACFPISVMVIIKVPLLVDFIQKNMLPHTW